METFFRYGNKIRGFHYKKKTLILLCHYVILKLGRAVRVPVGRFVSVMAAHSVLVSLSSGNAVSRSFRSDLMPAGDNRMSVCKHGGA